jgi:hypothetical protein
MITPKKNKTFQVFNSSTGRWVKFNREMGRIVNCKKSKGPYANIPKYLPKEIEMKPTITFEKSLSKEMLLIFNIFEDNEGYAVSKNGQRVIAFDGKELKVTEFAGVVKGKDGNVIFLKLDVGSLIEAKEMGLI